MKIQTSPDLPPRSPEGRPKVGMTFSGGGARCGIYVGIYQVLLENNIPIDVITGTSMGAVIGSLIAFGYSPEMIREALIDVGKRGVLNMKNFNYFNEGLFRATALEDAFAPYNEGKMLENSNVPFGCIAVNLESRKKIEFTSGPLRTIGRASGSLPLIFPPIYYQDKYLVDGGVLDNAPAMLARKLGAEKLIVFNIKNTYAKQKISGEIFKRHIQDKTMFTKINQSKKAKIGHSLFGAFKETKGEIAFLIEILIESLSIAEDYTTNAIIKKAAPDLVLKPTINIGILDFEKDKVEYTIESGRKFALAHLDEIKAVVNS